MNEIPQSSAIIQQKALADAQSTETKAAYKFFNQKMEGYLEAAELYFQAEQYDDAERCLKYIINKPPVTNKRTIFYDEAVFLTVKIKVLKSMKSMDRTFIEEAMELLRKHLNEHNNLRI